MTTDFAQWATNVRPGRNQGDQIIYYRRPLIDRNGYPAENAGWIITGDSVSGTKLRDYVIRGFQPLMEFGVLNTSARMKQADDEGWTAGRRQWGLILAHPGGPAAFPIDQIMTFRWYRPEMCPEPDVYFPQLEGQKVKEYRCPECRRAPFIDIDGIGGVSQLASHLRIMHEWDRLSLSGYGDRVGIDFNKADVGSQLVQEIDMTSSPAKLKRQKQAAQVEIETK